ncbi:MAG: aminopeptidase [Chloroflexi bacterium]|nr:aminopeptidase [Chloroflexota bacterium]
MKIYIMTDMEGVAGVTSSEDFCYPESRYYEMGRELTTQETNAAIEGAIAAGATQFLVVDGHGKGAIDPLKLHPAAQLLAGPTRTYPFGCDRSFDAAFIIGQHAKANTDGGHLCHTMSFGWENCRLNGHSIGELGLNLLYIAYFGIPTVLVSGDLACCEEAHSLLPQLETVCVKEGIKRGAPAGLTARQAERYNGAAIHLHPAVARERIRAAAQQALARLNTAPRYGINPPAEYSQPYDMQRSDRPAEDGTPGQSWRKSGADLIEVFMQPFQPHAE